MFFVIFFNQLQPPPSKTPRMEELLVDDTESIQIESNTVDPDGTINSGPYAGLKFIVNDDGIGSLVSANSSPYETFTPLNLDDNLNVEPTQSESTPNTAVTTISTVEYNALKDSVVQIRNEMAILNAKFDAQSVLLGQILANTANVDRFLTDYLKSEQVNVNVVDTDEVPEDSFDDLEAFEPDGIKTTEQLLEFEKQLNNKEYADRLIRYLRFKFKFNGANGAVIFSLVLRRLIHPELLVPYSWKSNNDSDTPDDPTNANDGNKDQENLDPNNRSQTSTSQADSAIEK